VTWRPDSFVTSSLRLDQSAHGADSTENQDTTASEVGLTELAKVDLLYQHRVELTPDDLGDIESAASKITVQGARYPERPGANDRSLSSEKCVLWFHYGQ